MLKINPEYLSKQGKREFVALTVEDFDRMKEAVEDARNLRALRSATRKNTKAPYYTSREVTQRLSPRPTRTSRIK